MGRKLLALFMILNLILAVIPNSIAEVDPNETLSTELQKNLFDAAYNHSLEFGQLLNEAHVNGIFADLVDYADILTGIVDTNPKNAFIITTTDAFDMEKVIDYNFGISADDLSSQNIDQLKTDLCFSMFSLMNYMKSWEYGSCLNYLTSYGTENVDSLENVAYVFLWYSEDLPILVIGYCNTEEGITLRRSGLLYYGEIMEIALYSLFDILWGIWPEEMLDVYFYKCPF